MGEFAGKMQMQFRKTSSDLVTWGVKFVSGAFLALTLSLIIQEVMGKAEGEAPVSFIFMLTAFTAIFMRISKKWNLFAILVFDLVCILIGMVLCLYIMVAPNA
jgi:hypothetical protein